MEARGQRKPRVYVLGHVYLHTKIPRSSKLTANSPPPQEDFFDSRLSLSPSIPNSLPC